MLKGTNVTRMSLDTWACSVPHGQRTGALCRCLLLLVCLRSQLPIAHDRGWSLFISFSLYCARTWQSCVPFGSPWNAAFMQLSLLAMLLMVWGFLCALCAVIEWDSVLT